MASRTKQKRGKGKKKKRAARQWSSLSWDDLDRWAGSRSVGRGRSYQRGGRVANLVICEDQSLLATVQGSEPYVTSVRLVPHGDEPLRSRCTCPVGFDGCKHAVAVVIEYLAALAEARAVPSADPNDPRFAVLESEALDWEDEDLAEWDTHEPQAEAEQDEPVVSQSGSPGAGKRKPSARRGRLEWDEKIRQHIASKSHEELVELVWSLTWQFPELREQFKEQVSLGEINAGRLVAEARRELHRVTSEIGWENRWEGEGHTPDYSRLSRRLERLLELGQADAVVELGRELLPLARSQIEASYDEGETAMEVARCLRVVFEAVKQSSLATPEKILFAIDAYLLDEYDMLDDAGNEILDAAWSAKDWSAVADRLEARVQQLAETDEGTGDSWVRNHRRDAIVDWLATALQKAGRSDELLNLFQREARATNSYCRLVGYLIEKRKYDQAEHWAREGIEKTCEKLPGIAAKLGEMLRDVARRRRRWDEVAAYAACQFFLEPSADSFTELIRCAAKAGCEQQVRQAALQFLETGKSPIERAGAGKRTKRKSAAKTTLRVDPGWPLPVPDYLVPLFAQEPAWRPRGPHFDVLLRMAIDAKKPDDLVAAAVAKSHPERALEIYQRQLQHHLRHANIRSYEAAAGCLRKMRPVMKSLGRESEWRELLGEIREQYRRRPRFVEILDGVEGRTIIESHKMARKRK